MTRSSIPTCRPSSEEIKSIYYGDRRQAGSGSRPLDSQRSGGRQLTPSTRFVVTEARKQLASALVSDQGEMARACQDENALSQIVKTIEETTGECLSSIERDEAVASLSASFQHFDLLTPLVDNASINDVIVSSWDDISFQVGRKNHQTDLRFASREAYLSFVENLLKRAGKSCTYSQPMIDVSLGGNVRVCVTHESLSPPHQGPMLTIRISRYTDISMSELVLAELAPQLILDYVRTLLVEGRATILISGEVGTGKTTLVRALISSLDSHESVLVIEDTHELQLARPFTRHLLTRDENTEGFGRVSPAQAIRTGMRMAMNRVVLGEMRDAESAEAFVDVAASGHPGLSTIHARSARDTLSRLELFLSREQPGVGFDSIRKQIANSVNVIVYLGVDSTGRRRIMEVVEVGGSSEGVIQVSPMYAFCSDGVSCNWVRGSGLSSHRGILDRCGVHMPTPNTFINIDGSEMRSH